MNDFETLKEKFALVQDKNQKLREERIRLESEIKTLEADYHKKLQELLAMTGAASYEEAMDICKAKREEVDRETEQLNKELDRYLAAGENRQ